MNNNHSIGHNKTMFDLFNMINPNCYQAFIIKCIIESNPTDAIQYCDELSTAINLYKWDVSCKQSDYIDKLICESNLNSWQKKAIMYIISNDVEKCKDILVEAASVYGSRSSLNDLRRMLFPYSTI